MERNSNARRKWGRMPPSSFPPPEEVYIIDDDSEPLPQAAVNELPKSSDSNWLLDSMPSFNLLEEFGEAEPATGNDEDECKIITERTVFDHIREKAKSFPVLATSKTSAYSPAPEAYCLTRNTQPLELQVEALEKNQRNELSPHTKVDSFSGFGEEVGNEFLTLQNHVTSGPHFMDDDKGEFGVQTEESKITVTEEETIFDHIKRKANSYPVVSQFSVNTPGTYSKLNQASRDSSASDVEVASMQMLSFDISMMNENKRPRPASPNISNTWNHQNPPVETKKNCCSLETATETREVDPFVGFKSVFSFL